MPKYRPIDNPEVERVSREIGTNLRIPGALYLGYGRHRKVWRHGSFVIKVPTWIEGVLANRREAALYTKYGTTSDIRGVCFARCKLLPNDWLVMEYVKPVGKEAYDCYRGPWHEPGEWLDKYYGLPDWVSVLDMWQAGFTKNGRVVAYDFGSYRDGTVFDDDLLAQPELRKVA